MGNLLRFRSSLDKVNEDLHRIARLLDAEGCALIASFEATDEADATIELEAKGKTYEIHFRRDGTIHVEEWRGCPVPVFAADSFQALHGWLRENSFLSETGAREYSGNIQGNICGNI